MSIVLVPYPLQDAASPYTRLANGRRSWNRGLARIRQWLRRRPRRSSPSPGHLIDRIAGMQPSSRKCGARCAMGRGTRLRRMHVRTTYPTPSARSRNVKAILCTRLGGPDDLELVGACRCQAVGRRRRPAVVSIKAGSGSAAFTTTRLIIAQEKYQTKPPPAVLARRRSSPGGDRERWAPARHRFSRPATGSWATPAFGAARQFAAVPADKLALLSVDLDLERAAGLTITYGTSYHALARPRSGPQGQRARRWRCSAPRAASGSRPSSLGKQMGARVIATASSDDKLARARPRRRRAGQLREREFDRGA